MPRPEKKKPVTIQEVLAALLDDSATFPATYLHQFSDLEGPNLEALRTVWTQVSPNRRASVFEDLEYLNDNDTLVLFDSVAQMALDDPDARVRRSAVRLLWETEDARLIPILIRMLREDPDAEVRAAVATALGKFIYLGEIEEIPETALHQVEKILLDTAQGSDEVLVRRRALEALGFSERKEVPALIRKAYDSGDTDWLITALFAMGRSADDKSWAKDVTLMLMHEDVAVQMEAINAAGELSLQSARRPLLKLLTDELLDPEVREVTIWALSNIGGEEVEEALEMLLEETEDEEEEAYIEEALENLRFTDDMAMFEMFDFENQKMIEEDEVGPRKESGGTDHNAKPAEDGQPKKRKRHNKN